MQFAQKLEIGLGAGTFLGTFVFFCFVAEFALTKEYLSPDANSFIILLFLISLSSLLVAVGAYFDAARKNNIALTVLLIGAVFVIATLGFGSFFIFVYSRGGFITLFPLVPTLLSALTVIIALRSRLKMFSKYN